MERNSDTQYLDKLKQANAERVLAWRQASAKALPPPTSFTSPFSFRRASLPAKRARRASLSKHPRRRPSLPSAAGVHFPPKPARRRLSAFAKAHNNGINAINAINAITPPGSRRGSQTLYQANKMLKMVMIDEPTPKVTFHSLKKVWRRLTCRQRRPST